MGAKTYRSIHGWPKHTGVFMSAKTYRTISWGQMPKHTGVSMGAKTYSNVYGDQDIQEY